MENNIVTPERLSKGDLQYSQNAKGEIITAQVIGDTWAHWLRSRGVLNDFDVSNADWFLDMYESYEHLWGYRGINERLPATGKEITMADQYIALVKCLPRQVLNDLHTICREPCSRQKIAVMWVNRGRWVSAMQRLDKALTTN